MMKKYQFPFGEYVHPVIQQDRIPKKVFVLGVYASAVHAKWIDKNGTEVCPALAVASEPRIFWDGGREEAKTIINNIKIPSELGKLELPDEDLNGPSARALENEILAPLGYKREDAWLCDLLPESRLNFRQINRIKSDYNPLVKKCGSNPVTVPPAGDEFCDDNRVSEITKELLDSRAELLILLGDKPIKQYLEKVAKVPYYSLRSYVNKYKYGNPTETEIAGKKIKVMPVVHPHHILKIKPYVPEWHDTHMKWVDKHKN